MMKAWHFLKEDKKLRYGDNRIVKAGETYSCNPDKLSLCEYGMHASVNALDALSYAPGHILCRVELSGKIIKSDKKLCAEHRKVIWMADATNTLHEFACWAAEQVLHIFEKEFPSDKRPRKAIEAKRKWLKGEITDRELTDAGDAAWAAGDAWAARAARAAGAAGDAWAAWAARTAGAARAAAWAAARAAAWDAAWAARTAGDAAWAARAAVQEKQLTQMFMGLKPDKSKE